MLMNLLSYKGYTGLYSFDPDAGIFHGEVLNLTDIITFQGDSPDELQRALYVCYIRIKPTGGFRIQ